MSISSAGGSVPRHIRTSLNIVLHGVPSGPRNGYYGQTVRQHADLRLVCSRLNNSEVLTPIVYREIVVYIGKKNRLAGLFEHGADHVRRSMIIIDLSIYGWQDSTAEVIHIIGHGLSLLQGQQPGMLRYPPPFGYPQMAPKDST